MKHERSRTKEEEEKSNASVLKKQEGRKQKIKDKGIDYEYEGHVSGMFGKIG
jgi:nucleolar protein 15